MPSNRRNLGLLVPALAVITSLATPLPAQDKVAVKLPKPADGWSIKLVAQAPDIYYPTAAVSAPDGTLYLGQDPMDMPGPPTLPGDSIVAVKGGKITLFADRLWAVMGLEWIGDTLYVMHPPYLSALKDTDGDGKADSRVDIATGLGPKLPGFSGINDHVASGMRIGIDGFLYISVGDKGIPKGVGSNGKTIQLFGGGVIRVRPDGTDLEVVSTGERNPLSVALSATDDIFTYGNDDDSKKWPNSLTHHTFGAHFGYPYEFLTAPFRTLPITDGQIGGSGCQGIAYNDDSLPTSYNGNLFFCDWGLGTVFRYEMAPNGGTFKVAKKTPFVTKGEVDDFRPFSMAAAHDGGSLYLVDWAFAGWLASGPKMGRIYELTYVGPAKKNHAPRPTAHDAATLIQSLDHPALTVRRESQQALAKLGTAVVEPLIERLSKTDGQAAGRIHAVWTLDAIGGDRAREAIRATLTDADPGLRLQGVRSVGIRRDPKGLANLASLLRDKEAPIRREAAIALERIGDPSSVPSLLEALGDKDTFASWSIRHALRSFPSLDSQGLTAALLDPKRAEDALKVCDESWSIPRIDALRMALPQVKEPGLRSRVVGCLAGNYRRYRPWSGNWFGTNPLAGDFPQKIVPWDASAMSSIQESLAKASKDEDAEVRLQAIAGLVAVGKPAVPALVAALTSERNPRNASAIATGLGILVDGTAIAPLSMIVADKTRDESVRLAAIEALGRYRGPQAIRARLSAVFDPDAPPSLVAIALPGLGRDGFLPPNDMASFLDSSQPKVRAAALSGLNQARKLPATVVEAVVKTLSDEDSEVRKAATETIAAHKVRAAIPTLIALANQPGLRNESVLALAAMPDPQALPLFLDALRDINPSQRNAAESSLMAIRDQVRPDLEKAAVGGRFEGPAALALERVLTRFQPIKDWKVIGPFARTTARVFIGERSIDFSQTHSGVEGRTIAWQPRSGDQTTGRLIVEDFKGGSGNKGGFGFDTNGSPDLCTFGFAEIESAKDRQALLMFGSSGTLIATVNEENVYTYRNFAGRAYSPESDVVRIHLKKGKNRLLVQSRQGIGTWSFSAAVSEPSPIVFAASAKTNGPAALKEFAMSHEGDPKSGEALFFDAKGVGCVKCHAAGGRGTANIGPDLTGLALKYDRTEIIRSVLEPSTRIATGYQPALIATQDGGVVSGLVRSESDTAVELIDSEAKTIRILKTDIEERKISDVSVMPTGLVDSLTPVQFADLVSYLQSLKAPGAATTPAAAPDH